MGKKLVILLLVITACNHDTVKPANSGMPDEMMMSDGMMMMTPCTDLSWLMTIENSIVQNNNMGEVYSYVYNSQLAYEIKPCLGCPDVVNSIKNCNGMSICEYANNMGNAGCQEFLSMAMEKKLIWKN